MGVKVCVYSMVIHQQSLTAPVQWECWMLTGKAVLVRVFTFHCLQSSHYIMVSLSEET